jgi:YD repeat-containing protein
MRILFALAALVFSTGAMAGQYYYTLDKDGSDPTTAHYGSADEACRVAYVTDMAGPPPSDQADTPLPYQAPTFWMSFPPNTLLFSCNVDWTSSKYGGIYGKSHLIYRNGDDCKDEETFNPVTGKCESPDKDEDRKNDGDPSDPAKVGVVACGDPVNPANGNVFESEADYRDPDGGLEFVRAYNSSAANGGSVWSTTFNTRVVADRDANPRSVQVNFSDGSSALFAWKNGVLVPQGDEFGTLSKVASGWTYRSVNDETMTFDVSGVLTRWDRGEGRFITIQSSTSPVGDVISTVTDHLGHTMVYTTHYGWPLRLVVGDLTIDYTVDSQFRLTGLRRTRGGVSSTRNFRYEDAINPMLLTGVVDERGVRTSTWAYDANGRATSATMGGGQGRYAFAYDSTTQTTVTNPLGNPTRFTYLVVQGAKRISAVHGEPVPGCPASNSTFAYDPATARLMMKTDARGVVTLYAYDTQGRETSRTEGKGTGDERVTTTTWDGTSFRPQAITTPDRKTTYSYDAQGRLLSTTIHSLKD